MKVGDRVKLNLTKEIEKGKNKKTAMPPSTIELWEAINGLEGEITQIVSDDEIWVRGKRTGAERMFNKETLELLEE